MFLLKNHSIKLSLYAAANLCKKSKKYHTLQNLKACPFRALLAQKPHSKIYLSQFQDFLLL